MLVPHLEARNIRLRHATPADIEKCYDVILRVGLESVLTLDDLEDRATAMADGMTVFTIDLKRNGETVGFCSLRGPERAGHMFAALYTETDKTTFGVGGEAMTLLINYAFANWESVKKVYFATTDASIERFQAGLFSLKREATLRNHSYFQGRFWDHYWYGLHREPWKRLISPYVNRLVSTETVTRRRRRRV